MNSIQEVVKDNAPGAAVDRMRELLDSSRHVTERLRGLVIDLAEQVANTSAMVGKPRTPEREQRSTVSKPDSRRL